MGCLCFGQGRNRPTLALTLMLGFPADIMFVHRSGKPSSGTAKEERESKRDKQGRTCNTY